MKKNIVILTVSLLLTLFCFCSCQKYTKTDKQDIERYKNSPRDSRIIGQWKMNGQEYIQEYKQDGQLIYGLPVSNEKNEITHFKYKKGTQEEFFYTESDSIINYLIVYRTWMYGSFEGEETYKIEQDTLYISMYNKPLRSGVRVYNQIKY